MKFIDDINPNLFDDPIDRRHWATVKAALKEATRRDANSIEQGNSPGSTGGGVSNHHLLSHLTDFDDHTQYIYGPGRDGGQEIEAINNTDTVLAIDKNTFDSCIPFMIRVLNSPDNTPAIQIQTRDGLKTPGKWNANGWLTINDENTYSSPGATGMLLRLFGRRDGTAAQGDIFSIYSMPSSVEAFSINQSGFISLYNRDLGGAAGVQPHSFPLRFGQYVVSSVAKGASFELNNNPAIVMNVDFSAITAARILTVRDLAGTIALLSDITSLSGTYQPLDTDLTEIAALANTSGDLLYTNPGQNWAILAKGSTGQYLKSTSTTLAWATINALDLPANIAYLDAAQTFTKSQVINNTTTGAVPLIINATTGTGASLIDLQVNGSSKASLSAIGALTLSAGLTTGGDIFFNNGPGTNLTAESPTQANIVYIPNASGTLVLRGIGVDVDNGNATAGGAANAGEIAVVNRANKTTAITANQKLTNATPAGMYVVYAATECQTAGSGQVELRLAYTGRAVHSSAIISSCPMNASATDTIAYTLYLASGDIIWKTSGTFTGTYAITMRGQYLGP